MKKKERDITAGIAAAQVAEIKMSVVAAAAKKVEDLKLANKDDQFAAILSSFTELLADSIAAFAGDPEHEARLLEFAKYALDQRVAMHKQFAIAEAEAPHATKN